MARPPPWSPDPNPDPDPDPKPTPKPNPNPDPDPDPDPNPGPTPTPSPDPNQARLLFPVEDLPVLERSLGDDGEQIEPDLTLTLTPPQHPNNP